MLIGRNARPKAFIKLPYKGCVVVQGPTYPQWIQKVKESWIGYQVIYSTWENADKSLYDESDIVIYNQIPTPAGVANLNFQKVSTINGFLKARELGWDRALKVRGDFSTTTADGLFKLFDNTKLNLHGYWNAGYIGDFFMEGSIDDILTLFDVPVSGPYPEWNLTKQLYTSGLNKNSHCISDKMEYNVADIRWEKLAYWFSVHVDSGHMTNKLPEKWG
jgi:hypothetical protein